jgi:hypothetical protein
MKVRRVIFLLIVAAACLVLLTSCYFIDYYLSQVYKVYGKVTVDGTEPPVPISSVEVFMSDYQYSELTNYNGDYEMELPEGTWTINFYKDDYEPATAEVTVGPDNPRVELNISMVWIQPPTPIDVTGYYDWFVKLGEEGDWELAYILYIHQTDSDLEGSMGFSGSISDSTVILDALIEAEEGEINLHMEGTVSGDDITGYVIEGYISGDSLEGEFKMEPSTLPFGDLKLEGLVEGVEISLDTEYGYGTGGETTSFELNHFDHESDVTLWFNVNEDLGLAEHEYTTPDFWVSITWRRDGEELHELLLEWPSWQGTLLITDYDADGIAGNFTMSKENTPEYLDGSFNVSFVELE